MLATWIFGVIAAMASSSRRKIMSAGVRALWMNRMSASEPRSYNVRVIDTTGVIPLPADKKSYLVAI